MSSTDQITRRWNSGPPPEEGWYVASYERDPTMLRYWHGHHRGWSAPCYHDDPAVARHSARNTRGESQVGIEWCMPHDDAPIAPGLCGTERKPLNPKDLIGVRKAPMSTVSAAVLAEIGVAMLEGACKYGRHNYRAVGVRSSVYYDGAQRHLMAWWEGEDIDIDSEMSHITKAITSLVVLRDAMLQGKLTDDRPPRAVPFYVRLNATAAAILDRHADKHPRHYLISDTV